MSLHTYRDEAGAFLASMGAQGEGDAQKLAWLEEEFALLREASAVGNDARMRHQIYDMLFLLFELAAEHDFDLDEEWRVGAARKQEKYLKK
ncbi:MAG: hypothetical protein ABT01_05895 [Clostridium sp. SCN 57-10]|nr:MAG: hypothetical protein ABT01_05895 [Clostridium sp. SCN 57-10]